MRRFEPVDEPHAIPEVDGMPINKGSCLVRSFAVVRGRNRRVQNPASASVEHHGSVARGPIRLSRWGPTHRISHVPV